MDDDMMLNITTNSRSLSSINQNKAEGKKISKTDIKRLKYSEKMKRNTSKSKKGKNLR